MDNNIQVSQNVRNVEPGGTVIGVQVVYQGETVRIPSSEDIQLHRAELSQIEILSPLGGRVLYSRRGEDPASICITLR